VYPRHAGISYNAKHAEQYRQEEPPGNSLLEEAERKNQRPKYWGSRTLKNIWGAYDYNNWQNNQHYGAPNNHQEKEKMHR